MPTLAELKAQTGPQPLPRASKVVTLVEGQHLLAESAKLADELTDILMEVNRTTEDGERSGEPRKQGQPALPPRIEEIKAEQAALLDRLADFQGKVDLRGVTGGEWQRFKDENPPRMDSIADRKLTGGECNASAVFAALGRFIASWDGDPVTADDWDKWLAERITYADRRDLVPMVVDMHEKALATSPKLRTSSPTTKDSAAD